MYTVRVPIVASMTYCALVFCRANAQQPKLFVGMILILIFAEALALYGLIGAPLPRAFLSLSDTIF